MKCNFFKAVAVLLFTSLFVSAMPSVPDQYIPPNGLVPDAKTAIAIAEAVLFPIYGEQNIKDEKPYKATLESTVWLVEGSVPKGWKGGAFFIKISEKR